ncbi:NAD binding domain of 6-phosphogluconate dehydrogenase-domain-containing protein [Nemania diffusa]|nr:NAD binding domain of 6-phosphogluconate dehydrogenase-domain-containing protein [Nemania diffusa]
MRTLGLLSSTLRTQRRAFSASARQLHKYGFIGLGRMGYQMAKNLQSKLSPSDSVILFDINKTAMNELAKDIRTSQPEGAVIELAENVVEVARNANTVITVLRGSADVKSVFSEMLTSDLGQKPGVFIDSSTIDPTSSREVAKMVADTVQGQFVDAPMSGGVVGATAGTLTFMLGSPQELVPQIEPILMRMGKRVLHCGEQGTGLGAKLANNYLLAVNNLATAEAMNLGIRLGLEPKTLANVINASTGRCWPSEVNNPVKGVVETAPANNDYVGGFNIALMNKDVILAVEASGKVDASLVLGHRVRQIYKRVANLKGYEGRDFSIVYRYISGESEDTENV